MTETLSATEGTRYSAVCPRTVHPQGTGRTRPHAPSDLEGWPTLAPGAMPGGP